MNKKLVCVLLAVAMLCMSSVAFAAVPSKTTEDMAATVSVASTTGVAVAAEFVVTTVEETEDATAELKAIADFTASKNVAPIQYFAEEVKAEAAALLPEGFDMDKLVMNEFAPLTVEKYDAAYGDVEVTMSFATKYTADQALVAMVGVQNGETVDWTAQSAEATAEGFVKVTFSQDVLSQVETGSAMIAILSEEVAE